MSSLFQYLLRFHAPFCISTAPGRRPSLPALLLRIWGDSWKFYISPFAAQFPPDSVEHRNISISMLEHFETYCVPYLFLHVSYVSCTFCALVKMTDSFPEENVYTVIFPTGTLLNFSPSFQQNLQKTLYFSVPLRCAYQDDMIFASLLQQTSGRRSHDLRRSILKTEVLHYE